MAEAIAAAAGRVRRFRAAVGGGVGRVTPGWRRLAAAATAAVALLVPAQAFASQQDAASTHALIAAGYALARASNASIPVAQARIQHYDRELAAECPNAGAGTPETEASQPMSFEVAAALWSISYGSAAAPIRRFARAAAPLHFSNARFERAVHSFASTLVELAGIPLPNLCADVRAWTASGFRTVPGDVLALDRRVEPLVPPAIPWGLVARYEQGGEASMVRYIERAEQKVEETEFTLGQKDWYEVIETVGLAP